MLEVVHEICASLHSDQVDSGDEFAAGAGIAASAPAAAEAAGFDAVYVTEHPIPNDSWLAEEGHHAVDPFVTLAVAAATSSLRVLTYLCVVPYHNPYVLAKTALTVDVLLRGPVRLRRRRGLPGTRVRGGRRVLRRPQ